MKRIIFLMGALLLVVGCSKENKLDSNKERSYTNKFECSRTDNTTQFQIDHKNTGGHIFTASELEEMQNSPVAIEGKISKVYDFNKDGSKLLAFYEIGTYKYLIDMDMEAEKETFVKKCDDYEKYGYKSCDISVNDNIITITREIDLTVDEMKSTLESTTLASVKEDYAEGEIYTCE